MFDQARILNEPVTNHIKEKSQILKSMDHIVFGAYEDEVFHLGYLDKACLSATPRVCSRSTNKVFLLFSVLTRMPKCILCKWLGTWKYIQLYCSKKKYLSSAKQNVIKMTGFNNVWHRNGSTLNPYIILCRGYVSGWGGGNTTLLQQEEVSILSQTECIRQYGERYPHSNISRLRNPQYK